MSGAMKGKVRGSGCEKNFVSHRIIIKSPYRYQIVRMLILNRHTSLRMIAQDRVIGYLRRFGLCNRKKVYPTIKALETVGFLVTHKGGDGKVFIGYNTDFSGLSSFMTNYDIYNPKIDGMTEADNEPVAQAEKQNRSTASLNAENPSVLLTPDGVIQGRKNHQLCGVQVGGEDLTLRDSSLDRAPSETKKQRPQQPSFDDVGDMCPKRNNGNTRQSGIEKPVTIY